MKKKDVLLFILLFVCLLQANFRVFADSEFVWVVSPQYQSVFSFSEGLASVTLHNSLKSGYIGLDGKLIINPIYKFAFSFKNGFAKVTQGALEGIINKTGEYIIPPKYNGIQMFEKNGEIYFSVSSNGKVGYMDTKGQWIIQPFNMLRGDPNDELIAVSNGCDTPEGFEGEWGYINKDGELVLDYIYEDAQKFSEGLAAVKLGNLWGYINKDGEIKIKPQYLKVKNFSDGLAPFCNNIRKWGFLNKEGEVVISPQFDEVYNFENGLACIRVGLYFGFINTSGEIVVEPIYTKVDSYFFKEDAMFVRQKNNKWILISRAGKILSNYEFEYYSGFNNRNWASVKIDQKWGCIDKEGNIIIEPKFENPFWFSEGLAAVKYQGKYGFINQNGDFIIKPQFVSAWNFQQGLAAVAIDNTPKKGVQKWDFGFIRLK